MTTIESPRSPTIDVDEVVRRFGDLPTLAPIAVEVLRLAEDDRAGLDDIAEVIGRDPGLASQLLRLANSSLYSMGNEVTSLSRAAAILGLRTVKLVSLSFSLVANVGSGADDLVVWRRSLAGSATARTIANILDPQLADECFVAALLGHIGKLALAGEPLYQSLVEREGRWPSSDAEQRNLGLTSDEVTRRILESWEFPRLFGEAIEHRSVPEALDGAAERIARILNVADKAARLLTSAEESEAEALEACKASAVRHLSMNDDEIERVLVDAGPAVSEIAGMFEIDGLADIGVTDLLIRAKENLARVSLDVVAALSEEQQRADLLETENVRLANEAATDSLTQLPNRRTFDVYLENQVGGRLRSDRPGHLGLLIMDIDKFKSVNDTFGHQVGDDVLRGLADRLKVITRRGELVARLGGEEFAVVLPLTDPTELAVAADRFRADVGGAPIDTGIGPLEVTVSIGTASTSTVVADTAALLYRAADAALYAAKQAGRNCVVAADRL